MKQTCKEYAEAFERADAELKALRDSTDQPRQPDSGGDPPPECRKRCEELKEKLDELRDQLLAADKKIIEMEDELRTEILNARIANDESQKLDEQHRERHNEREREHARAMQQEQQEKQELVYEIQSLRTHTGSLQERKNKSTRPSL